MTATFGTHRTTKQTQDKRKDGVVANYISNNNIRILEFEIKVFGTKSTANVCIVLDINRISDP